jgi:hypothetical protein
MAMPVPVMVNYSLYQKFLKEGKKLIRGGINNPTRKGINLS